MPDVKNALKTTVTVLAVIWVLNQVNLTRNLVGKALTGN